MTFDLNILDQLNNDLLKNIEKQLKELERIQKKGSEKH